MKRKNLMTALLCAVCLAAVPMAGCGEQKAETKKGFVFPPLEDRII